MGLAARTALALVATATLAVGLSAVIVGRGLGERVRAAAETRLASAAGHAALLAADEYSEATGWTRADAQEVAHAASISGYRGIVLDRTGAIVPTGERPAPGVTAAHASAPVAKGGRRVGTVRLEIPGPQLDAEERDLAGRIRRLDLVAALLAVAGALLAVPLLASTVLRPIRRLHEAVGRLRDGVRVPEQGPREIAELAARFNALSEGLAQEETARRAMAADVAHELRTPLNGLLLRIEAAQDGIFDAQEENLRAMHGEARRLAALIADVEALADAERPGVLLSRERLDLREMVHERIDAHAGAFAAAGVTLEADLPCDAFVLGDPGRLAQVLDNLLTNALRYTDRGGSVGIGLAATRDRVVLEVRDTGVGIAQDDLPHVFDRFWRADRSRSRVTGGSGVGLAVAHRLVTAHGGRLSVESRVGEGSSFRVELPAAPARAGRRAGAAPPAR